MVRFGSVGSVMIVTVVSGSLVVKGRNMLRFVAAGTGVADLQQWEAHSRRVAAITIVATFIAIMPGTTVLPSWTVRIWFATGRGET
jgi:hypothetical protein